MGKIYKAMGDRGKALQNFTNTQNLDPKMMHVVKTAIEKLENDNEISMTSTSVMSDTNLEGESAAAAACYQRSCSRSWQPSLLSDSGGATVSSFPFDERERLPLLSLPPADASWCATSRQVERRWRRASGTDRDRSGPSRAAGERLRTLGGSIPA